MTATFQKLFQPITLTTSAQTIYTVPNGSTIEHFRVRFTNVDSANHTVTAYAVPSGSTPATGNAFMVTETVTANTHTDVDVPVLGSNDFLSALASAGSVIVVHGLDGILFS